MTLRIFCVMYVGLLAWAAENEEMDLSSAAEHGHKQQKTSKESQQCQIRYPLKPLPLSPSVFLFVSAATFPSSCQVNFMHTIETFHRTDLNSISIHVCGESKYCIWYLNVIQDEKWWIHEKEKLISIVGAEFFEIFFSIDHISCVDLWIKNNEVHLTV